MYASAVATPKEGLTASIYNPSPQIKDCLLKQSGFIPIISLHAYVFNAIFAAESRYPESFPNLAGSKPTKRHYKKVQSLLQGFAPSYPGGFIPASLSVHSPTAFT